MCGRPALRVPVHFLHGRSNPSAERPSAHCSGQHEITRRESSAALAAAATAFLSASDDITFKIHRKMAECCCGWVSTAGPGEHFSPDENVIFVFEKQVRRRK